MLQAILGDCGGIKKDQHKLIINAGPNISKLSPDI